MTSLNPRKNQCYFFVKEVAAEPHRSYTMGYNIAESRENLFANNDIISQMKAETTTRHVFMNPTMTAPKLIK